MWKVILGVSALALGFGCGDDAEPVDSSVPDSAVDTGTVDTGSPDGGGGETLTFTIVDPAMDGAPVAGVVVGLDEAGGDRLEQTTGADGIVTFEDVVVTTEPGWLTVVAEGWAVQSVHLTESTLAEIAMNGNEITLFSRVDRGEMVTVTGTIANVMDPSHIFTVQPDAQYSVPYEAVGPDFEVTVPANTPFTVTALEWERGGPRELQTFFGTVAVTSDGFAADGTLDIDLSTPLPYETASGTISAAPAGHPLADAQPYLTVRTLPAGFYGAMTSVAPASMGWDFVAQWVEPAATTDYLSVYMLNFAPAFSTVRRDGVPTDGALTIEWLEPPDVVTPAFGASQALHDTVVLADNPDGVSLVMDVLVEDPFRIHWLARTEAGATEITLPQLPASVNEADVLPADPLAGRVRSCEFDAADPVFCDRMAGGRFFDVTR